MLSDEQQRIAALSVKHSFIVQAPAGSGKTSLLVRRFINLLSKSDFPEECLAITFTKKAALEMQHRILKTLKELVQSDQYPENHIYLNILKNPDKLQISTIDAFALNLIKKMPLLSKTWINFEITNIPKLLYQEAVEQLLSTLDNFDFKKQNIQSIEEYQDNRNLEIPDELKPLIHLLEYFSNNYELIIELLINLLSKREQWLPLIVPINFSNNLYNHLNIANHAKIRNLLENNLKYTFEDILIELSKYLPSKLKQIEILNLAKYAANNIEDTNNPIINCKNLNDTWPDSNYEFLPIWKGLKELLLTKDGKPRVRLNATQGFTNPNNIKVIKQKKLAIEYKIKMEQLLKDLSLNDQVFLSKLQQVSILPENYKYAEENWKFLESLIELLPKLTAHLMIVFEEHRMIDFAQVNISALEAISNESHPIDFSLTMEYQLKHILIDEFQDTSNLQFNLLEKLVFNWEPNDGKTIFIVGDPMQSIYRFRQANVGLFLKVQQTGIANLNPINLTLTNNFRSSVNLIKQFNHLFSKIFPLNDDIIYGGIKYNLATYNLESSSKLIKIDDNLKTEFDKSMHEILNYDKLQFFLANNTEEEAEYIVNLIKKIKQFNSKLSIVVLFRVKSQAYLIIKKLKKYNITYQANDLELFTNQEVINDLLILTKAILHVNDKIAWFALLRGPLIGLKLQDLNVLFENNNDENHIIPFFTQLNSYKSNSKLSKEALSRLNYVVPILTNAIYQVELHGLSIAKLVKSTWLKLGGDLIIHEYELDLVEKFFYKLTTIKDPLIVDSIEQIIENNFIEINTNTIDTNSEVVQLMTIHKVKGLEFDIVILSGIDKGIKNVENPLLLWELRNSVSNHQIKYSINNQIVSSFSTIDAHNYLLFAPIKTVHQSAINSIYNFMKYSEQERDLHEAKRLLYVALTRAKNQFLGFMSNNNYDNKKSFLKFLEPYINIKPISNLKALLDSNVFTNNTININANTNTNDLTSITLRRLPNSWYIQKLNQTNINK